MLRFKQFAGRGNDLENAVNAWLTEFEPDVQHMTQHVADDTVYLSFLFEESFRGQELRYASEHGRGRSPRAPAADMPDRPLVVPVEPGSADI